MQTEMKNEPDIESRREDILKQIRRDGRVRVSELSQAYSVSEVTIRGDLADLERKGLLDRVHGGAVGANSSYSKMNINERRSVNAAQKRAIAAVAASMIRDGETVFINSGTTCQFLAAQIRHLKNILVLTNSMEVAQELGCENGANVVFVGGNYEGQYHFTYGKDATMQIGKYHADKFFFSCDGVHETAGFTTYHMLELDVCQAFLQNSALAVALADYSKIGRISRVQLCELNDVDTLVTNAADSEDMQTLKIAGLEIIEA